MNKSTRQYMTVPNLFTTINLFCGFASVIATISGMYVVAGWIIFMAGIADALDGRIARAFGTSSEFGLQLDSLADVVASGIAPSILLYQYHLKNVSSYAVVGLLLGFMPLLFAAFRLARFNVTVQHEGRKNYYSGLPAPSAAATLASLVIFHNHVGWPALLVVMVVLTPVISLTMASSLRYETFPHFNLKERGGNRFKLLVFFTGLVNIFIFPEYTLFIFMMIYFLSGPVLYVYSLINSHNADAVLDDEDLLTDQRIP